MSKISVSLTKDADKLMCLIYKEFLSRRKNNVSKAQAKNFADPSKWPESFLRSFSKEDIKATLPELKQMKFIRSYIYGGFQLEDAAIVYMEQRFPNGISEVLDFLGKIMNLVPFV